MLSELSFLSLRLVGPMQSWGFDSQFNRRTTGLMPSKSAIAGICCAALGLPRGSLKESEFLKKFMMIKMLTIRIPPVIELGYGKHKKTKVLDVRRLDDYHTIQGTKKADGGIKECHITHRQYLSDVSFGIILEGESILLKTIENALIDPVWGVWLGRKCCVPAAPILAGLKKARDEALRLLIGDKKLELFTHQEEVESFSQGNDSIPDQATCFDSNRRSFIPRRIVTHQAEYASMYSEANEVK